MLIQSDAGETVLYPVTKREPSREEFLVDSGAAGDAVPMDLSILGKGGKGKKGKGKGKSKTDENNKDDKDKDTDKKGKGKGENNVKAEYFAGYCLQCKGWGHMKKDCW